MKIRFALALTALLPLMVACKAQDGTADTAAPAAPAATEAARRQGVLLPPVSK